jgi:hypothetical protein
MNGSALATGVRVLVKREHKGKLLYKNLNQTATAIFRNYL